MVNHDEAAQWLGKLVCVHWGNGEWFVVDYGYGVLLSAITAMHVPKDCDRLK